MDYIVELPWPPSVNHYWKRTSKGMCVGPKGVMYQSESFFAVRQAQADGTCPYTKMTGRVAITMECYPPDRRKRDIDNLPKAVLDALTNADIWEDDSQVDVLVILRMGVEKPGRIRVMAKEIDYDVSQVH